MPVFRAASIVCFSLGMLCLLAGFEQTVQAAICNETLHGSKVCVNAYYKEPVESASGGYCVPQPPVCVPAQPTSNCVDKYGQALSGQCIPHILGSAVTYNCYKDSSQTVINVPFYTARCVAKSSGCKCEWTVTSTTQPTTVCDCHDVEQ